MNCSTPYFLTCICHSTMSSHSIGAPSLRRPMLLLCQRSLIFSNPCLFSVSVYVDKRVVVNRYALHWLSNCLETETCWRNSSLDQIRTE